MKITYIIGNGFDINLGLRDDTERRLIPEFKSMTELLMLTADNMDDRIFVTLSDKMFQMSRI